MLTLALAVLQGQPIRPAPVPPDSYADSATAQFVSRARAARDRNERLVTSYTAIAKQRIGVGIRALARDRMLYRQELAAKITWFRDRKSTVEVIGAREGIPIALRRDQIPEDLHDDARSLVINPAEDYLEILGDDTEGFLYPLRAGGEFDYRFSLGDTTVIGIPNGGRIRLIELRITPRRSDWRLVAGSFWYDGATFGLVRAAFRPARPYEFRRDAAPDDREDVPRFVNPVGEIKFVTLEYGLYEGRWWMLRYAAAEALGTMGSWLGLPVKFERIYDDYEVTGGSERDTTLHFTPAGTLHRHQVDSAEHRDTVAEKARSDSLKRVVDHCIDSVRREWKAEGPERPEQSRMLREKIRECGRHHVPRDSILAVIIPPDSTKLLESPALGPPILDMGDLINEKELRQLGEAIGALPSSPWTARMELPHGVSAVLSHARYNRVEALSLGAAAHVDFGKLRLDGLGRIGLGDKKPNLELTLVRPNPTTRLELGAYHHLAAANPETRPFGVVNSVLSFLAHRDDGEYFRSTGVSLTATNASSGWWSLRLYGERQRPVEVETRFSVPRIFGSDAIFRPNIVADSADQLGASLGLRARNAISRSLTVGGELSLQGERGDYDFAKAQLALRTVLTPSGPLAIALEGAVGTSTGSVTTQSNFFLGGPATLRGYSGGVMAGEAFWRGRFEVANAFPAARLAFFTDAGWAGPRGLLGSGRPLLGAGIGASFLDGLIRLDLSRGLRKPTGWRFDLYLDGIL